MTSNNEPQFDLAVITRVCVSGTDSPPMTQISDDESGQPDALAQAAKLIYRDVKVVGANCSFSPQGYTTFGLGKSQESQFHIKGLGPSKVVSDLVSDKEIFHSKAVLLPTDPVIGRAGLLYHELTPDRLLGILAASGIQISLPGIVAIDDPALLALRDKYAAERLSYIDSLRKYLSDVYQGVKNQDYSDTYQYAKYNSSQEILMRLRELEAAIKSNDSNLLRRIGSDLTNAVPDIAVRLIPACVSESTGAIFAGEKILRILCTALGDHLNTKARINDFPDVAYLYKLSSNLK